MILEIAFGLVLGYLPLAMAALVFAVWVGGKTANAA
jgi:hypothetical protein